MVGNSLSFLGEEKKDESQFKKERVGVRIKEKIKITASNLRKEGLIYPVKQMKYFTRENRFKNICQNQNLQDYGISRIFYPVGLILLYWEMVEMNNESNLFWRDF